MEFSSPNWYNLNQCIIKRAVQGIIYMQWEMPTNHLNSTSVTGLQNDREFSKKVLSNCFKTMRTISEQFYFLE